MHRKPLQIFVQSPHLQQFRHEFVTGNQTVADLKRPLFPEPHHIHHLSSFYFTLNGKPLPDETPLSALRIAPLSTLFLRSRLYGGDAGRRNCYSNTSAEKKPDKVDPGSKERLSKWLNCALSNEPLREPCVIDKLGNVFNKEALVGALLGNKLPEEFGHIKGLEDMIAIRLSPIPGAENGARFQCPVSGLEFNGMYKVFALRTCGHVLSEKALEEDGSSSCLVCREDYAEDDKIVINGNEDEAAVLRESMEKEEEKIRIQDEGGEKQVALVDALIPIHTHTEHSDRTKRRKVETTETIEESTLEGTIRQNSEVSVENVCTHPGSFGSLCIRCGQKLDEEYGVSFGYIHKGLRLHDEEISRLRNKDMKNLLCQKKLYLVLDLDNTLLNTTRLGLLSSEELHLLTQTDSLEDISNGSLFKLECLDRLTKLRPFVRTFLKEASEMFEMYIYTMAKQNYALEVAKLLDPHGEYFNAKVISRADGTQKHQKGLDVVLGPESAILILDDTHRVWKKHRDNLIMMKRYHYFASDLKHFGINCKSLAEMKIDESETEGILARILNVLKQVHFTFFDKLEEDYVDRDVRKVLSSLRSEVLSGCVIYFARTLPALSFLREIAKQMGATCLSKLDPSVTHFVFTAALTEKFQWPEEEKKFMVHPQWIYDTYFCWQKQPEGNYVCQQIDRKRKKTGPDTATEGGATTITATDSAAQPLELRQEGLQTATAVMDSL